MHKTTTFFIRLRRLLAPMLRAILESSAIARFIGVKAMSMYLRPTVQWEGHTVSVDPTDFGVSFELESTGEYEATSIGYCKNTLKPGMTFVDVGANIGLFSLIAARAVGPTGKVYSFEPGAGNCALLRKNMEQNHYPNVTAVEKAVSDKSGTCTLYLGGFNTADHRIYHVSKGRKQVQIECIALDDYFAPGTKIDFIKMDIEGAEELAVKGMQRVLSDNQKLTLVIECWPTMLTKAGTDPLKLFQGIQDKGFQLSVLDDASGTITQMDAAAAVQKSWDNDVVNILCIRE